MTPRRWTVDDEYDPCWDHDTGQDITLFDLTAAWNTNGVGDAHAALVQCVRDADKLAKARDLAARYQPNGPGTVDGEYGEIAALLDLLTAEDVS